MERFDTYVELKNGTIGHSRNLHLALFNASCKVIGLSEKDINIAKDVNRIWIGTSEVPNPGLFDSRMVPDKIIKDINKYTVSLDVNSSFDPISVNLDESSLELKLLDSYNMGVKSMMSDMLFIPVDTGTRFVRTKNRSRGWNSTLRTIRQNHQIQPNRVWWKNGYTTMNFKFYTKGGIIGFVNKEDCFRLPNYLFNNLGYGAVITESPATGLAPSRVRFTNNASIVSAELNMGLVNKKKIAVYVNFGHGAYYRVLAPSVYIYKYGAMTYTK